jgi:hypothetical protein
VVNARCWFLPTGGWKIKTDTAIRSRVTKPRIFNEAFHFRARLGTKDRLDVLRGSMRQGDFIRLLIEEALDRREADVPADEADQPE